MWIAFGCLLAILVLVVLGRQFGLAPLMRQLRGLEVALTEVGAANFTHALAAGHADNEIGRIVAGYERMRQDVSGLLANVKRSAAETDKDVAEARSRRSAPATRWRASTRTWTRWPPR